jgi:predicted O-linked N-acetylglucosamine transferase (SPINDLY family)
LALAHYNLGNLLMDGKRLEEAEASFRQAISIDPNCLEAHYNLANTLKMLDKLSEAENSYRQAISIRPDSMDALANLGNVLLDMERTEEACACYRRVLQIDPENADAHNNLGSALYKQERSSEAEASFRQAIRINQDFVEAHNNLGFLLCGLRRYSEAEACYRQALRIDPDNADVLSNFGDTLAEAGYMSEAEIYYRKAMNIRPDWVELHCSLARALISMGNLPEAIKYFQRALEIKPDYFLAQGNLIFTQDMMADVDVVYLQGERKRWDELHAAHLNRGQPHANAPDPERRLRIGYVSADFRAHSAAFVFGSMLVNFDRERFEVIAYSNHKDEDVITRIFKDNVTCWRNISKLSDAAAAELIREDGIDILVDLSGHSAGNRLLVFARKPAPIQITAWGYAAGTGMSAMDVFFSDKVIVPPEEVPHYAERVIYLPCALSYYHPDAAPRVNMLPALSGEGITFGSFNRLEKNSDLAYRAWAEILKACPNSRMILKTPALDSAGTRTRVLEKFAVLGIDPERIVLLGRSSRDEHMAAFNRVDIALDPFPHGGGVTALEGLLMGVPMVTLRWPSLAGRVSASIMTAVGMTDWIAESPEQYVELAVQKAKDLQGLSALREKLREMFTSSIVGDQGAYVQAVEKEYRVLWREWCEKQAVALEKEAQV